MQYIDMIDKIDNYYLTKIRSIEKCQILEYKMCLKYNTKQLKHEFRVPRFALGTRNQQPATVICL